MVACANDYSRQILTTKGLIANRAGTAALVYRPYHLCGVETPLSILCAAMLQVPTGATEYLPRFDAVAEAAVDLAAGEAVGGDSSKRLRVRIRPARAVGPDAPLPLSLATGNRLKQDVAAGATITVEMVERPADSTLWALRAEQDAVFLETG